MGEHESRAELLKRFLTDRDAACPLCGYNVQDLTASSCPECGARLELTLGMAVPRIGWFIGGLAGLSAGVGFNGFNLTARLGEGAARREDLLADQNVFLMICLGSAAILLAVWMRWWRWIGLMSKWQRSLLATACWAASIGSAVAYFRINW